MCTRGVGLHSTPFFFFFFFFGNSQRENINELQLNDETSGVDIDNDDDYSSRIA